jgi:hypothetical protein
MKHHAILLTIAWAGLSTTSSFADVLLTGFGTGQITVLPATTFTATQTSSTLNIAGTDGGTASFQALFPTVNITGNTLQLALTGTINGTNPASTFEIDLYDGNVFREYQSNFSNFGSGTEKTVDLTLLGSDVGFDPTQVQGLAIFFGGTGSTLNFTFDQLSAVGATSVVPEPSTYALLALGFATLGFAYRRRRV